MANLYATSVGSTTFGANARQLNLDKGQTFSATNPITDLGTPQLQAINFSIAGVNMSTTPTIAGSNLQQLVSVVQATGGEIYFVGAFTNANPSVGVMLVKKDTLNDFDTDNVTEGYGKLETAINNAISGATATLADAQITGLSFS
jgi:hypothetical protein